MSKKRQGKEKSDQSPPSSQQLPATNPLSDLSQIQEKAGEKAQTPPQLVETWLNQTKCYDQGEAAGYLYPQHPPTSRQDRQVRVTMCRDHMIYDHMICMMQGHVTSEQHELTGGLARRARIASCASQQVRELAELTLRAMRANRCESSQSSQTILYISSEEFPYGILIFNSCCDPDY